MNTMKKLLSLTLVLALGISLFSGCSKGDSSSADVSGDTSSSSSAETVEPMDLTGVTDPYLATAGIAGDTVVATVGDYEILADDVLYWLYYGIDLYASQNGTTDIPWDTSVGEGTVKDYLMSSALETAAFYRLLPEMGAQEGLELSQEDLDYAQQDLAVGEASVGAQMVDYVLWYQMRSRDQYIRASQANAMYDLLQDHYFGPDSDGYPTDAETLAYAQDELGYYHVKHILLSTTDETTGEALDDAAKAEKRAQAENLLAQLQAAEDKVALFDELMNQYSEDPGLAYYPDGYDAYPGQMVAEFEKAALALKDGEISGIVESEHGYHIILRLPLTDLEQFRSALVADRMQAKVDQWMTDSPTQTTDAWAQIDPVGYRENILALQAAVSQEVQAYSEAQAAAQAEADGSGSAAGSAG